MIEETKEPGSAVQPDSAPEMKRYKLDVATNVAPMQRDHLGRPYWESYQTPDSYQVYAQALVPPHVPGIVIFVHGVNSEGEWYEAAERELCDGLNERLGRTDLRPNKYLVSDPQTNKATPRRLDPDNFGRSPVIRFYWGYRAKDGEERAWKVPLRNVEGDDRWKDTNARKRGPWYWGGGPFQNGTNNLQQLWSDKGFDRHVLGFVNLQWFNSEWDRELHDAPGRRYYAHAAQRLADLIDRIRTRNPQDTITVMAHSQGTMVAMAATLMCKQRAPDSLVVMNSPFALEDKASDALTCLNQRPTTKARINTFRNVANRIKQDRKTFTAEERQLLHVGATQDMELWHPDAVHNGVPERDNHGRFYVYFNPHDRVMGAEPLQSIGWQGVNNELIAELGDTVKQRMLARGTPCGDDPGMKKFGTLPPIPNPEPGVNPAEFWNGNRRDAGMLLWHVPNANQMVNINAEKVPYPVTKEEMSAHTLRTVTLMKDGKSYEEQKDRYFDESRSDQDALGARDKDGRYLDSGVPYLESVHDREKLVTVDDVYSNSGKTTRMETQDEMLNRIEDYQPMPTNHSTLPQFAPFMKRVAAWDLPIGFCDSYDLPDFWLRLIREADWTQFTDPYFNDGTFELPPVPGGIDRETVADEITKAQQEELRRGAH
ncbi:T6SS effector phospholipase Tle3 domain-containing protein [Paraburkholderia kururiensis]|uniref:T6SS effector phospholipase Tle3 domain-containing protein n=1 Tax=Paraburkholderia kururiensis TaxID=984307 RepID=UPI00069443A6|nr:alpha/beta hydrolase [Paraburkholderia kururiensis]